MKGLIKLSLVWIASISSLIAIGKQGENISTKHLPGERRHSFQDTVFIKNYIATNKTSYLYSKPSAAAKTKIKIPKNVMITTISRSGDFEYGDFSVSSSKSFKGWFLVSDLQAIMFSPPKTN